MFINNIAELTCPNNNVPLSVLVNIILAVSYVYAHKLTTQYPPATIITEQIKRGYK